MNIGFRCDHATCTSVLRIHLLIANTPFHRQQSRNSPSLRDFLFAVGESFVLEVLRACRLPPSCWSTFLYNALTYTNRRVIVWCLWYTNCNITFTNRYLVCHNRAFANIAISYEGDESMDVLIVCLLIASCAAPFLLWIENQQLALVQLPFITAMWVAYTISFSTNLGTYVHFLYIFFFVGNAILTAYGVRLLFTGPVYRRRRMKRRLTVIDGNGNRGQTAPLSVIFSTHEQAKERQKAPLRLVKSHSFSEQPSTARNRLMYANNGGRSYLQTDTRP